jgi:hypothetical protein
MPNIPCSHGIEFASTHKLLIEKIAYEERKLELFMKQEAGAVYRYEYFWYDKNKFSDYVYPSYENALNHAINRFERDEVNEFRFEKIYFDNTDEEKDRIEISADYDGNVFWVHTYKDQETIKEWIPEYNPEMWWDYDLRGFFYIDIPVPFKRGDILTHTEDMPWYGSSSPTIFVLEGLGIDDPKRQESRLRGEMSDGTDLIGWGLYVTDNGVLFGDHTGDYDGFIYYKGELEGNDRLLHYVSLFYQNRIRLPELLTMQNRIMFEKFLKDDLLTQSHGVYILDELLAENRLNSILSDEQHKFLADEMKITIEAVKDKAIHTPVTLRDVCANIVTEEVKRDEENNKQFNSDRLAMAEDIIEELM